MKNIINPLNQLTIASNKGKNNKLRINYAIEFEDIDTPDWLDEESEDAVEM